MPDLVKLPWRVGDDSRTIWADIGGGDPDDDILIGMMDYPQVAAEAVEAHNARLPHQERRIG